MAIIAFVVSLSFIAKITDLIARGVPWQPVAMILVYALPTAAIIAIPLSALVSCLLLFGRLSADGEITAMRASGVSIRDVTGVILVVTAFLVAICLYISHELEPRSHLGRRSTASALRGVAPLELIEEGRFIRGINGVTLYVGRRRDEQIENVRIYDSRKPGMMRQIRAGYGRVQQSEDGQDLILELNDVRVEPVSEEIPGAMFFERWTLRIENIGKQSQYKPDEEDMAFLELVRHMRRLRDYYPNLSREDLAVQRTILAYTFSQRSAQSFSCLALVLIGIPLGIQSRRSQSSIGILLSLGVYFVYQLVNILAESLSSVPAAHPELLTWLPVAIFSSIGIYLINRAE